MGHRVAACSSGLVALDNARRSLLDAPPDALPYAVVASADAAITPALVHSYKRLGVLGEMTPTGYIQRPLDERRLGFMLSEMGVAVLLKRVAPDQPLPDNSIELTGSATACEPYDIVRSPPTMTSLARLWRQVTDGKSVDVIHPHAPGTREHDPAELGVLLQAPSPTTSPPPDTPPASPPATIPDPAGYPADLYAVKGAIGHSLGASGLASLVVAAMCLRSGKRPPMPWLNEPMTLPDGRRLPVDPAAQSCSRSGTHAVLAAGFGGHLAAAVLQGHGRGKMPPDPTRAQR